MKFSLLTFLKHLSQVGSHGLNRANGMSSKMSYLRCANDLPCDGHDADLQNRALVTFNFMHLLRLVLVSLSVRSSLNLNTDNDCLFKMNLLNILVD